MAGSSTDLIGGGIGACPPPAAGVMDVHPDLEGCRIIEKIKAKFAAGLLKRQSGSRKTIATVSKFVGRVSHGIDKRRKLFP
uniref:Uncharacterized protein n=1 Tax=Oryza punctata TaxID=4537 RepID=A0A0E0KS69_ORYPU